MPWKETSERCAGKFGKIIFCKTFGMGFFYTKKAQESHVTNAASGRQLSQSAKGKSCPSALSRNRYWTENTVRWPYSFFSYAMNKTSAGFMREKKITNPHAQLHLLTGFFFFYYYSLTPSMLWLSCALWRAWWAKKTFVVARMHTAAAILLQLVLPSCMCSTHHIFTGTAPSTTTIGCCLDFFSCALLLIDAAAFFLLSMLKNSVVD